MHPKRLIDYPAVLTVEPLSAAASGVYRCCRVSGQFDILLQLDPSYRMSAFAHLSSR